MNRIGLIVFIGLVLVAGGVALWYDVSKAPETFVPPINQPTSTPPIDKSDLIVVDTPKPGDTVKGHFVVKGKARGNWFFEASFPIELSDSEGNIFASEIAHAKGDWMTTDFVPFEGALYFMWPGGRKEHATLVLKKNNPSGLPQHDDSISIPVIISTAATSAVSKACVITGCSGQICSNEEVITTCEYRTDYACYKTAKCERQSSGACGWTQTAELQACLKNPSPLN